MSWRQLLNVMAKFASIINFSLPHILLTLNQTFTTGAQKQSKTKIKY